MAVKDGVAVRSFAIAGILKRRGRRISPKVVIKTKQILTKQAEKIVKQADAHEHFLNKIKYCLGVFFFGTFCYLLGSRPQDIPKLYCLFFLTIAPLRWLYYRIRKWHYFLLDFCYYANVIFMVMLLYFPNNEKLFMICFSFSEGPLSWALIVWRCSLVFSSFDKIISVLIHLLPGTVFFIIRWWDPITFPRHSVEATGPWPAWPVVMTERALWTWLFMVPLLAYTVWQILYFAIVNGLRRQRFLSDPEVMTSYRELSRKASKANNIWWRLSGLLGDGNRVLMYAILQAIFTVITMALTVPMFKSYRMHILFELLKVVASIWNGGNFLFEVMPHEAGKKRKRVDTKASSTTLPDMRHSVNEVTSEKSFDSIVPTLNKTDYSGVLEAEDQPICALCRQASSLSEFKDLVKEMNQRMEQDQAQLDQAEADITGSKLCKLLSLGRSFSDCSDQIDPAQVG